MAPSDQGLLVVQLDTPAAEIFVDGQKVATRSRGVELPLPPGNHWVEIHNGRGKRLRRSLIVRQGQRALFALELPPNWLRPRLRLTGR